MSEPALTSYAFTVRLPGYPAYPLTAFRQRKGDSLASWAIRVPDGQGKRRWVSLRLKGQGKDDLALLKERARLKLGELLQARLDPPAVKVPKATARGMALLGQLEDAYREGIGREKLLRPRTVLDAVSRLYLLVKEGLGERKMEARGLPATVLTASLVEQFQQRRLVGCENPGRTRRTIDQTVTVARSMFTHQALTVYRKAGLVLPDLTGFMGVAPLGNWNSAAYVPIPPLTIKAMAEAARVWRGEDPSAYLAFLLMFRCGMRNSEVFYARRSWVERIGGAYYMAVIKRAGWPGPKNRRDRRIPLPEDVRLEIEALAGEDWLLHGHPTDRLRACNERVCDFVRKYLPSYRESDDGRVKAAYELRKHYGAVVASTQGLDRAAEYLGDRMATVEKHYHAWLRTLTARAPTAEEMY
jgi:hypothetical protein